MSTSTANMTLSLTKPVMKQMVLGTGILATKMLLTNGYSMFPKLFAGFGPPEDSWFAKLIGGPEDQKHSGIHHNVQAQDAYLRAQRVVMNDLENIPIAIIVFWVAALANPKSSAHIAKMYMFFVGARCFHSAFYLAGLGTPRTASFFTGYFATLRAIFLGLQGVEAA